MLETIVSRLWNRYITRRNRHRAGTGSVRLGNLISDGCVTEQYVSVPERLRLEHVAILGKTGSGKSSLMKYMVRQDIEDGRGFCFFDLHGDATGQIIGMIAQRERILGRDLSDRLIVIEPADPEYSVGLNLLESSGGQQTYVQIAEFTQILKLRWQLDRFGPRTEELLRNALAVLSDNNVTLVELPLLLSDAAFRTACIRKSTHPEAQEFFRTRYNRASEGMQALVRDAILNKTSAFTADPHFRHIIGQVVSSFSFPALMDSGKWLIVNLDKGRLGEQASVLGALLVTKIKNAVFARSSRRIFSLYCDELPNLLGFDSGIEALFSEARKFGVSICSANQFSDQYGPHTRAAIAAVGTHLFFQLSALDAEKAAQSIDGGRSLATVLKNLSKQELIAKISDQPSVRVKVPDITLPTAGSRKLLERSRKRWARVRSEVEVEIEQRTKRLQDSGKEELDGWE